MEIHKPKPWHGWREFLKEIATIVIGVLIALGAEQGVEWLHWQEKTQAAEAQMQRELSFSWGTAEERIEVTPCLEQRLAALEDRLLAPGTQWAPLPPMVHPLTGPAVYLTPSRNWDSEVWRSLAADGTVGHVGRDRQVMLGRLYVQIGHMEADNRLEFSEIGELNLLGRALDLDRTQRLALSRLIERERWRVKVMGANAKQIHDKIPPLIRPTMIVANTVLATSGTLKACRDLGLLGPGAH
ncbi:hypothetical protein [Phenylobacterium sp.]|uniref:hypothetical protein n=1 Tax=Phenylobacterium sp. TaxID=1871053 RepID=UPI00120C9058|nr:hypothetical protein [Phenylobacterium sp.]THD70532.1 MAG: hypothetical protein E8A12_02945 [Phenylobacterium sp.]